MQVHPWVIASWPIIERTTEPIDEIVSDLTHLGTTVSAERDDFGRLLGHTIWGGTASRIGIAWDWVEALEGVFALSDPMGVVSNIGYVDQTGALVPDFAAAVRLNRITHSLPWQAEVAKATSIMRRTGPRSDGEAALVPQRRSGGGASRVRIVVEGSAFQSL
ncbi:MAG: hypothetical protein ABI364_01365 [Caldimonas sp.]